MLHASAVCATAILFVFERSEQKDRKIQAAGEVKSTMAMNMTIRVKLTRVRGN